MLKYIKKIIISYLSGAWLINKVYKDVLKYDPKLYTPNDIIKSNLFKKIDIS